MDVTRWSSPSHDRPRGVTILGSTGSVGQSTVDLIARDPDAFRIEALVAATSVELLADQARRPVRDDHCRFDLVAVLAARSAAARAPGRAVPQQRQCRLGGWMNHDYGAESD